MTRSRQLSSPPWQVELKRSMSQFRQGEGQRVELMRHDKLSRHKRSGVRLALMDDAAAAASVSRGSRVEVGFPGSDGRWSVASRKQQSV
jgi:hypothetical protein